MSRDFTGRTGVAVPDIKTDTALEGSEVLRIGYARTLGTRTTHGL